MWDLVFPHCRCSIPVFEIKDTLRRFRTAPLLLGDISYAAFSRVIITVIVFKPKTATNPGNVSRSCQGKSQHNFVVIEAITIADKQAPALGTVFQMYHVLQTL